jgi:[ribosomal protein S18]-alanine N-acetyltransferase
MYGHGGGTSVRSVCQRSCTPGRAAVGAAPAAIEAARATDLAALIELDRLCFSRRAWPPLAWAEVVVDPEWTTLVIRHADVPVAAAVLVLWPPGAHLASLGVHPDHRRSGLGTALLRDAMARTRRSGAHFLSLEVDRSNQSARRLYRREGFGLVRRFREDGRWRVVMHRRLRRADGS